MNRETYQCNSCGRTFTDKGDDIDFTQNLFHEFAAYTGYSSPLDDEKIEFMLCERCLMDIFRKFKHQPTVHGCQETRDCAHESL